MSDLDERMVTLREVAESTRVAFEAADLSLKTILESFDDARRRVRQLEDEQSAGYSFRKLSPSCCPACGLEENANLVDAINVLRAGHAQFA